MKVLVTGASGYIATHVIDQLLTAGHLVRGTVRSLSNEVKVKPLRQICPENNHNLELVEADLLKAETWKSAVGGCDVVIHVASPVPFEDPANEDDVIKPALEGTLNVLRACADNGHIKRVVLTSSIAASERNDGHKTVNTYSEDDWTEVFPTAYSKSKTLAEKAAWDFVKSLPDGSAFELVTINPALAVGPILCAGSQLTSVSFITQLMNGKMSRIPHLSIPFVDVRDVAKAHLVAMEIPGAVGRRFMISSDCLPYKEVADILHEELGDQGYRIARGTIPNCIIKCLGMFSRQMRYVAQAVGKTALVENTPMKVILGIRPIPSKQSIIDTAHSLIEKGIIPKTAAYKGTSELRCTTRIEGES